MTRVGVRVLALSSVLLGVLGVLSACMPPTSATRTAVASPTAGALGGAAGAAAADATVAIQPRKGALEEKGSYPCSECHDESLAPDPRERELTEAHEDVQLAHGDGQLWCTSCHHEDRGQLKSAKGTTVDFDEAHVLCSQCHFEQKRDWDHGAHGKRIGPWNGPRVATACTTCHDAHAPAIKARAPWSWTSRTGAPAAPAARPPPGEVSGAE